jgi:hypothetical protein
MNAIPQNEIELAVLEAAFSHALEAIVGLPITESEQASPRGWPGQEATWTAIPLERPFHGRCWAVAPPALATELVARKWPGMVLDDVAAASLFGDLIADVLNACIKSVRRDAASCMFADHHGLGYVPKPTGERTSVVLRVAGQPLFIAVEHEPETLSEINQQFPAWSELALTA